MEWLIVGGVWFWIITALVFILLVWEVSGERIVTAVVTVVGYLFLIHLFGNASIFSIIREHPAHAYIGIPLFFILGALWSIVKWWFFVKRNALRYRELRMDWLCEMGLENVNLDTPVPDSLKKLWDNRASGSYSNSFSIDRTAPLARTYKKKIINWMIWWPFSMFWTLIDEPWRLIYEAMTRLFQKISNRVYTDAVRNDFVQTKETDLKIEEDRK
jgi:hypothetical protein